MQASLGFADISKMLFHQTFTRQCRNLPKCKLVQFFYPVEWYGEEQVGNNTQGIDLCILLPMITFNPNILAVLLECLWVLKPYVLLECL